MISKLHPAMLIACAVLCAQAFADDAIDLPKLVKATRKAVVLIVVFDKDDKPFAQGTGFFVSADGKLITNCHVIKGAFSAVVKTDDDKVYTVTNVIARSEPLDYALLQVDVKNVPFLKLGDSDAIEVGQRIAVLGNPLGLDETVSEGIISAKRPDSDGTPWLQFTAPISPGSSGSPLMNAGCEVIGVATLANSSESEGQNLNFAIPINIPKTLLANYLKNPDQKPQQVLSAPPSAASDTTSSPPPETMDDKDEPAYKREHPLTAVELSQEDTPLGHRVKQELDDTGAAGPLYKQYLIKFWKRGSQ